MEERDGAVRRLARQSSGLVRMWKSACLAGSRMDVGSFQSSSSQAPTYLGR